jgi:hypothetical protein
MKSIDIMAVRYRAKDKISKKERINVVYLQYDHYVVDTHKIALMFATLYVAIYFHHVLTTFKQFLDRRLEFVQLHGKITLVDSKLCEPERIIITLE